MWVAINWAEVSYIVLTGMAYMVFGVAMLRAGSPAPWAAWACVEVGAVMIGMVVAPARVGFPQLPLLVLVGLGIALLTS